MADSNKTDRLFFNLKSKQDRQKTATFETMLISETLIN